MLDRIYKIKRNFIPALRGLYLLLFNIIRRHVKIGKYLRVHRYAEIVLHPGCKCMIGNKVQIGRNSVVSISHKGSLIIGNNCSIGSYNHIICHGRINIGDRTILAPNVQIYDHNHLFNGENGVSHKCYNVGTVTIGTDSWIGAGTIILNNVHIGDRCVIGAGSVVTKDLPDNCIAVGNPCKAIKNI